MDNTISIRDILERLISDHNEYSELYSITQYKISLGDDSDSCDWYLGKMILARTYILNLCEKFNLHVNFTLRHHKDNDDIRFTFAEIANE